MRSSFLEWLTRYEAVAIWLEGIALALIFVWDRIGARDQIQDSLEDNFASFR